MGYTKGVTLIEILIVISIVSILLMVTILKGSFLKDFKEKQELKEFKYDIEYTRNRAIVESKIYYIEINSKENYYSISNYSNIGKNIVKKKEFTQGIKLLGTNIRNDEIIFGYSGAPRASGTIYLENGKGEKIEITIVPVTGKVNIRKISQYR